MDKMKSKPRGRPRIARSARKRNFVTMRMRDALKASLEEAAEANQRSSNRLCFAVCCQPSGAQIYSGK